ncbi:autotransporter assembly complex family protein [Sphingomonas limnosediminicola]|uniref:Autotransporter assembly complex family protein n=1 Tax=Sphingomonas limnosediminicola TaxID=940133 RepID=A0ABP7LZ39_9SPHN
MIGRGSVGRAAWLLSAASAVALAPAPALAQTPPAAPQQPDAAELDPSAPLAPMPDLGVEWPDLNAKDETLPATAGTAPTVSPQSSEDGTSQVRYAWTIEGIGSVGGAEDILKSFRAQSALETDRKKSANAAQIGRRSRADADLLTELLRSQGYYDAVVEPRTERAADGLRVVLTADPGQQYRFASVELPGLSQAGEEGSKFRDVFGVKAGDPVIAQDVIDAGTALTTALGQNGFASAKIGEQRVDVNHQTHLATLVLPVDPGPVARFGTIRVSGSPPFSARHLAIIARFKRGDLFKRSKIDDLRRALIATTLVASADVEVIPVDGGRVVDLAVKLEPAPSHTIAGELGYGTGQGVRAEASWTDRNFMNPEGALTLRGVLGTREQLAAVQLRRSNFMKRDQVLNLQASAGHQRYDAYEARTVRLAGNIERQSNFIWQKTWTWSYGAEVLATDEQGVFSTSGIKDTRTFFIAALPLALGYDGSDNLLDPTTGFRLSGRLSPELSAHGGKFAYARGQIDASAYKRVSDQVVAAGRIRLGTIVGASAFDIAPSRRFYSGGGGSVRGYGYQQLGPKDADGDPIGGRGLAEFALEARIRLKQFGGNFGVVPFFDGGSLTYHALPDFSTWRFAAGIGARYYSSFGPIRIDLGVPLNRQKGDGLVAVTVSLGQAF